MKYVNEEKIIVMIKEIESWYLAGLGDTESKKLKIPNFKETDTLTKEKFNNLILNKFESRINFLLEILDCFSIEKTQQKNESFNYFLTKVL